MCWRPISRIKFLKTKKIIFGLTWFSWPLVEIATKLVSDVVHLGSVLSQASELSKVVRCRSGTVTHGAPESTWTSWNTSCQPNTLIKDLYLHTVHTMLLKSNVFWARCPSEKWNQMYFEPGGRVKNEIKCICPSEKMWSIALGARSLKSALPTQQCVNTLAANANSNQVRRKHTPLNILIFDTTNFSKCIKPEEENIWMAMSSRHIWQFTCFGWKINSSELFLAFGKSGSWWQWQWQV